MPERLNGINPLVDNFISKRLSQSDKVKRKNDESGANDNKRDYYDRINISHLGKLLNAIQKELKEKGDKEALSGLDEIMDLIGRPPSNLVAVNFVDIAAALSEKDDADFVYLFVLADKIAGSEIDLRSWINSLINFDLDCLKKYLLLTGDLLKKDRKEKMSYYIKRLNQIAMNQDLNNSQKSEKLDYILNKS